MNNLVKTVFRRFTGNVTFAAKHHHHASQITKFSYDAKPLLGKEANLAAFIQNTIIPMNIIDRRPSMVDKPCFHIIEKIDTSLPQKGDITPLKEIDEPSVNIIEKKAHRMLRIRRKKMKKHQRRKLRKRMHYNWAKIRRKREAKKETAFRNEIIQKLKEAKRFSAEEYVSSKLELYRREIVPLRIPGGVRMPEFVVREVMETKRKRWEKHLEKMERRRKLKEERSGSLAVSQDDRFI